MKIEFSRHIIKKYSYIKFHENPSSRCRVAPCGQTDGQTDMTKLQLLSQFCERAFKLPRIFRDVFEHSIRVFERSKDKKSLRAHFDRQNTCSVVDWRLHNEIVLLYYTLGIPTAPWYEGVWINEVYRHLDARCRQMTRFIGNIVFRSQFRTVNKVARLMFGAFDRN